MKDYKSILSLLETEVAIKFIKDRFEAELANSLHLTRVSAPLFVFSSSGLNDGLNGVERPVSFEAKDLDGQIEIVHSLAKWKREALYRYNIPLHQGIYADMNAIRRDESLDALHSIYVDQWDYEIAISKEERTLDYLFSTVRTIYGVIKSIEVETINRFPALKENLPNEIAFVSTTESEALYPDLTRKERELALVKQYGAVFLYQIGWDLNDGLPHDGRAPDYDDWMLNGDILVYNDVLDIPFELSSMGIRVDGESLRKQVEKRGNLTLLETPFAKGVMDGTLPFSLGGGIGQSRLCMLYLKKAHIGEVQSSLWSEEEKEKAEAHGIHLL